jgi:HSP20 family protein
MLTEPFSPLFELSRDVDRGPARYGSPGGYIPAADVVVTDEQVTVTIDVPGLRVDDLEVELENDVLTVRGERRYSYATDDETRVWQRMERGFGNFERSLQVPYGLDPDAIEASLDAGVLALRIPRSAEHRPKRVQIAAGEVAAHG